MVIRNRLKEVHSNMNLRRYLIAGLVFWLPIIVTIWVVHFLVSIFDRGVLLLPTWLQPAHFIGYDIPGIGLLVVAIVLLVSGLVVSNFLGRKITQRGDQIVAQIPLVRTIYTGVKQTLGVLFSDSSRSFREVVLIQFPMDDSYALGFVTNTVYLDDKNKLVTVFIPTAPNPTSGFVLNIAEEKVTRLSLSVDEAFKYVISLGAIVSEDVSQILRRRNHDVDENSPS